MGTTAQKLQYLVNAKAAIDAALTNKGVTPPTELGDYGTAIGTLGYKDKVQQIVDRTVTEITADDLAGCTEIGRYTFCYCASLISIIIPDTIRSIGISAIYGCEGLTNITIPDSVTSIVNSAFGSCTRLTSITIFAVTPPNLINISAFENTNNCPIYVPAASVEAYKAATNWTSLADRIFAIQE